MLMPSNADLSFHLAIIDAIIWKFCTLLAASAGAACASDGKRTHFPSLATCARPAAEFWFNSCCAAKADVCLDTTTLSALADNTVWSTLVLPEPTTSAERSGHVDHL